MLPPPWGENPNPPPCRPILYPPCRPLPCPRMRGVHPFRFPMIFPLPFNPVSFHQAKDGGGGEEMDQPTHLQSSPPITLDPLSYPSLYRPIRLWLCGVQCRKRGKRMGLSVRGKLNDYAFIVLSFHDFPLGFPVRKMSSIIPNFPDGLGHN